MNAEDFNYDLPNELIAHKPLLKRDDSRLLVIDRQKQALVHKHFYDLPKLLTENDVLVFNNTKVFPARLFGAKISGGKVEVLLLKEVSTGLWKAISKPGLRDHQRVVFGDGVAAEVMERHEDGIVLLAFNKLGEEFAQFLDKSGNTPLPPYIQSSQNEDTKRTLYQTVYAQHLGSSAAPTAGLHFSNDLLNKLKSKGVQLEEVTLHVGLGTFKPVTTEQIENQKLHEEDYVIEKQVLERLNQAKMDGKRIISVGTTSARTLESAADSGELLTKQTGSTELFIQPGYKFRFVDSLITNFHVPQSSLLMLVTALVSDPNTNQRYDGFEKSLIYKAYREAIKNGYRFYSFGDATLIF